MVFFNQTPDHMKRIYCILSFFVFLQSLSAQTDSAQKIQFKLGLNYNSNLNYYGRTDSLRSTGFFPMAELWMGEEWYVNAAPVFVNNNIQSFEYAGTVATLGYLSVTDKWMTNFYFTKPFYKESSQLVQSALKAQGSANFSFLNKLVNITAGGDIKLSDKIDFGATFGLDHLIRKQIDDNSVFVINPSFYTYAGTQNFTNTYYKNKTGFLLFPGNTERVTENVKKFNVLAYEFSAPVIYASGKWMALVTPSYVIPQNLVSVEDRPELSEMGRPMFYTTVGFKYSF
jgi:hypothetical protein